MNRQPSASTLDEIGHGLSTGRSDGGRVFRRAMRHSRHVRVLRVAIPAALAALIVTVALAAWFYPLRMLKLPGDIGGLVISGTKITMAQPKLSGYTRDSRWYELTAAAAAQDITKPDIVELKEIRAKLEMADKSTMDLTAADGVFDRKSGVLTLGQRILLITSTGYEVRLSEVVVDTGSGNVVSNRPVEVKMTQGLLNANKLEVTASGDVVRFEGGVTMNLDLGEPVVRP